MNLMFKENKKNCSILSFALVCLSLVLGVFCISCEKYPLTELRLYQITFSKAYSKELLENKGSNEPSPVEIRSKIADFINGNVSRSAHLISFKVVSNDMLVFDADLYGSDAKKLSKNSKIANVTLNANRVKDPFK